ncbi:MAG: hypothetical protein ACREIB_07085, partial [Pseudomonadota bacterium]
MSATNRLAAGALLVAVLILGCTSASRAQGAGPGIAIKTSRAVIRQGETFRLTLQASEALKGATVRFAGRPWPLYTTGQKTWVTILGTDPLMPVGKQVLAVEGVTVSGL